MPWWESIVRIERGGVQGSGVFIDTNLVLTAGHVVQPMGSPSPEPGDVAVLIPFRGGARAGVRFVGIHDRWISENFLLADIAVLRVDRVEGVGLGVWRDFGSDGSSHEVAVYGYPAAASRASYQAGFIRVVSNPSDERYRTIESDAFEIASGMSGSPFLTTRGDGNVYVAGLATWDSNDPTVVAFNGLPLLPSTFDQVVNAVP